jgi:hypothetical protein
MPSKEWVADVKGHEVVMTNSWSLGSTRSTAKLYIDGECVDTCDAAIVTFSRPCLRGRLEHEAGSSVVLGYLSSFGVPGMKGRLEIDGAEQALLTR